MKRAIFILMVPLLLGACGSTGPDDSHSLNGEWESSDLDSDEIRMTISVTNREVTGHGSITNNFSTLALTIDGIYVPPSVSLNLGMERFDDINFEGSFEDDNTLSGTLRGSGYQAQAVTFTRVEEGN